MRHFFSELTQLLATLGIDVGNFYLETLAKLRLLMLRQGNCDRLLFFIANEADAGGVIFSRAQGMTEVAAVMNRFAIDLDDYVSSAKACFIGAASFFYRAHQDALPVFSSKEVSQLRRKIFHHQTTARRGMHDHD